MREQAKILIVGNGGRENAIGSRMRDFDPGGRRVFYAVGNDRTVMGGERINVDPLDIDGIRREASLLQVDLVIPPNEKTLSLGIVDAIRQDGRLVLGPTQQQAKLESSKIFSQSVVEHLDIPAPKGFIPDSIEQALAFVRNPLWNFVIKADGLAEGKGVYLPDTFEEAQKNIIDLMQKKIHGSAGERIVLQERLYGVEESLTALVSGRNVIVFPKTFDNKRLLNGDKGPNTGGMGAIVEPFAFPPDEIVNTFVQRIADYYADHEDPLHCFVYPQLIHTASGTKVLEYNMRPGDPESQAQLIKLLCDPYAVFVKTADGTLQKEDVVFDNSAVVNVVLAAGGYPVNPVHGNRIYGLDKNYGDNTVIFHAGTVQDEEGYKTQGGRVLNVVAKGRTVKEAGRRAYRAIGPGGINFEGMQYRKDLVEKHIRQVA